MLKLKTLADLKRIPVGTKLRLVQRRDEPINELKTVYKVTSQDIALLPESGDLKRLSYLWIPKAKGFEPCADGFEIYALDTSGGRYRIAPELKYVIVE